MYIKYDENIKSYRLKNGLPEFANDNFQKISDIKDSMNALLTSKSYQLIIRGIRNSNIHKYNPIDSRETAGKDINGATWVGVRVPPEPDFYIESIENLLIKISKLKKIVESSLYNYKYFLIDKFKM